MSDTLVINEIYLSLQGESTLAGLPCVFIRLTACNLRCSYCDTAYAFKAGEKKPLSEVLAQVRQLAEPYRVQSEERRLQGRISTLLPSGPLSPALSPRGGEGEDLQQPSAGGRSPSPPRGERAGERGPDGGRCQDASSGPEALRLPLVELTGGEPLLQKNSLPLMTALCDEGFIVLLETSGAHDIAPVDRRVRRIMDLKCPSSGEAGRNRWENLPRLKATDEIKFVIGTREDYEWAREQIRRHKLEQICPLLFSWVHPLAPEQQDKSLKPVPPGQTPISRRELAERIIADALPVRFQAQLHKLIWPPEQRGV